MVAPVQSHSQTSRFDGIQQARQPHRSSLPRQVEDGYVGTQGAQQDVESALRHLMAGETPGTKQFADSYGRVKHLALMFSSAYLADGPRPEAVTQVLDAYKTLFTRMEPDTKFTIVCATDADRAAVEKVVRENAVPNPERIQLLRPDESSLTVWARDMMVPKWTPNDPNHTGLMAQQPLHDWHLADSKIPGVIADANPSIRLENQRAIVTDGGDVESNTKESFVGYYSLAATENKLHDALAGSRLKADVIGWYQDRNHVQVVETAPQTTFPFRFVADTADDGTPITRMEANPDYRAPLLAPGQVSDATMYDDLAVGLFRMEMGKPVTIMGRDNPATPVIEEPATDHMDMGMTPIDDHTFLVGDPTLTRTLLSGADTKWSGLLNRDHPYDFNEYARQLEAKGYEVKRIPHHEPGSLGEPYISYNNCLMERFEKDGREIRRVFLPVYGIEPLDKAACQTWESVGYEVIPLQLSALSSQWGALRCISNWLDRSPQG